MKVIFKCSAIASSALILTCDILYSWRCWWLILIGILKNCFDLWIVTILSCWSIHGWSCCGSRHIAWCTLWNIVGWCAWITVAWRTLLSGRTWRGWGWCTLWCIIITWSALLIVSGLTCTWIVYGLLIVRVVNWILVWILIRLCDQRLVWTWKYMVRIDMTIQIKMMKQYKPLQSFCGCWFCVVWDPPPHGSSWATFGFLVMVVGFQQLGSAVLPTISSSSSFKSVKNGIFFS